MPTRLTTASYLVLGMVEMLEPASPYDIKQLATRSVSNFWTLPHTQIYAQCDKLVAFGLLDQQQEQEGRRRRVLRITDEGRRMLAEWRRDTTYQPNDAHDLGLLKMFLGSDPKALAPNMIAGHKEALSRYQWRLDNPENLPERALAVVKAGIAYRESQIAFWSEFLESSD